MERILGEVANAREVAFRCAGVNCYMMMAVGGRVAAGDVAEGRADPVVDATVACNSTRLIKHWWEPNRTINEMDHATVLVLEILAVKEIQAGAEIMYDYLFRGGR